LTGAEPVTLARGGGQVEAGWTDAGIPQAAQFNLQQAFEFPALPPRMLPNGSDLLKALREAAETADHNSARFARNHIRLCGHDPIKPQVQLSY
jgi:hypothetical protein